MSYWHSEDTCFHCKQVKKDEEDANIGKLVASFVALVLALLFFLQIVFNVLTPKAQAQSETLYQDVHSVYGACAYARAHPGAISNWKEVKKNCA